ncbi:ABC transporter permease [Inquilinus sp.]|jgi:peptide/nickel transport system permease protein|uniref:ABC transporter permease n=1 Tax=Inquilinus sp. TaxID=1932117 RepID=UPI003782D365
MSAPSEPVAGRRVPARSFAPSATLVAGVLIVGFWAACALVGDRLVPFDPYADDLMTALAPPSAEHWFGTDRLGRDVFSRVVVGARDILAVAPLATLLGGVLGTLLGLVTGYFKGWVDAAVSRVLDALLALPTVIVALMALAARGAANVTVVVVIGLLYAPLIARTVRAAVRAEREKEYVAAAQLSGENAVTIMLAEILPNVLPPIMVEVTLRLGYAIFQVATLSFLGFGIQPPSADWGLSIAENYALIGGGYWWTVLFDGLATISLVVGVNLAADGVERALAE